MTTPTTSKTADTPDREPRWASLTQAADYAGRSTTTIRRWVRTGHLPVQEYGSKTRIVSLDDLDAFTARAPQRCPTCGYADRGAARFAAQRS